MICRCDTLLVGQGLAGSLLASELIRRGENVVVVDDQGPAASSRVAAGMINPLAGRRLALMPQTAAYLEAARQCYDSLAQDFSRTFFHPLPIHRFFQNETEAQRYEERRLDADFLPYLGEPVDGGFITLGGGWVDLPALLESVRGQLHAEGRLREVAFAYEDLALQPDSARWGNIEARQIIFCEGWRGARNPWFDWLPWDPVKGEILDIEASTAKTDRILNRGKWVVPGPAGFRAGSTYERDSLDGCPTEAGRAEILAGLRELLPVEPSVIGHRAGVRPGTRTQQPFLGRHPGQSSIIIFNGFGSKGTLLIPYLADLFCDHLSKDYALPPTMDIRALWKS